MLTGDSRSAGEKVGKELGLDQVCSELLPADKVAKVEELIARKTGKGEAGLCGRRYQRCAGIEPGGHRHCHGRDGI